MIRDNNEYDWKLCFTDGGNGHSLWFDRLTERYTIKDQSGDRPHLTDDGVLWLGCGVATVHTSKFSKDGLCVKFEMYDNRGFVDCVFDFGIRVAKEIHMEVVMSGNLKKLEQLDCFKPSTDFNQSSGTLLV